MGISNFQISGHCHNSRAGDDVRKKLCPVTKLDKRNKKTSTKSDDNFMSKNCDAFAMFSIYGKFGSIRKPNFGRRVYKTYIFINSHLFLLKQLKTELKNFQRSPYTIALSKGNILSEKR